MELVIDRSKWYRGQGDANSRLLLEDGPKEDRGKMCCLGFYSKACGVSDETILDVNFPSHLHYNNNFETLQQETAMEWLWREHGKRHTMPKSITTTELEYVIGGINDDSDLTEAEREAMLIPIFAQHGITVTFIN